MILLIDYRERSFINKIRAGECNIDEDENDNDTCNGELIEGEFKWGNINVMYKIQNLEVGDFIIKESIEGDIRVIIERKTIKDLCASIVDGRFREQKERLKESVNDTSKILYIIEGHKNRMSNSSSGSLSKTIIDGSILNLIYRHNYKILQTENESDTFENIVLLYKKIKGSELEMVINNESPIKVNKMIKKGEKIAENIMAIQLSVIPGVSYNTSCIISSIYKNMKSLIDVYNNCEDEEKGEKLLKDIQINDKRRLGVSLSKKIYESIMK